jgi:phosphonoacetaldehyde hydrolase
MGMSKRDHVEAILSEPAFAQIWLKTQHECWSQTDVDWIVQHFVDALLDIPADVHAPIAGAYQTIAALRAKGIQIGSTTGYSRASFSAILSKMDGQANFPQIVVCSDEVARGRPAPDMIVHALSFLDDPARERCVTVDDAMPGLIAGRRAGTWTIACAASGNGVGLGEAAYQSLTEPERRFRLAPVIKSFTTSDVDFIVETVADLSAAVAEASYRLRQGRLPGTSPPQYIKSDDYALC